MKYEIVAGDAGLFYFIDESSVACGEGYIRAGEFGANGLALVKRKDNKWYYINDECKVVSEGYIRAGDFSSNGLAVVKRKDGKWYYINDSCEIVSEGYMFTDSFSKNGLARVVKEDGVTYYINNKFEIVGICHTDSFNFGKNGSTTAGKKDSRSRGSNKKIEITEIDDSKVENKYFLSNTDNDCENSNDNKDPLNEGVIELYLNGILQLYDLPDECFVGKNYEKIIENEKKIYYSLIKSVTEESHVQQITTQYKSKIDFIEERAREILSEMDR